MNDKFSILGYEFADIGYYINLKESLDRKANIEVQENKYEIKNLIRVDAEKDEVRESSATKSHIKVFNLAKQNGHEIIVVFEDDFQIYDNVFIYDKSINKPISIYLKELSEHINNFEWDIILLGYNAKKYSIPQSKHLSTNYKSTGAWGYLIKKRAYEYIIDNFNYNGDRLAIDDIIPHMNYLGFKSLTTNVQVIHHAVGFVSTLDPKGPVNYDIWIEGNYHESIWGVKPSDINSFDECLNNLFDRSEIIRNFRFELDGYDGDKKNLSELIEKNPYLENSFMVVNLNDIINPVLSDIKYDFWIESRRLLHINEFINTEIGNFPKKIKKLSFNNNSLNI